MRPIRRAMASCVALLQRQWLLVCVCCRYTTELDHNREQYDLLREEKMDIDHEFSERLRAMEITHQSEMQKRESLYQSTRLL